MLNVFINLFKTSKTQLGIFLTLIFITAFLNNPSQKALLVFLLSLISTVISDLLFVRLRNIKLSFPSATLVTGSIIGLLTSPNLSWYVPVVIGIIAMFSKNFIRFSNRHIFNPAGFGLLVSTLIFHHDVSWWGVSFQKFSIFPLRSEASNFQFLIPFLILLSPALVSILRMKRYRITLSFLITYALINTTLNSFLDPTVLFFSIVMLPEPMTSPNRNNRQILFGLFVAIISIIASFPISNLSLDPLIFSLLLGNLSFFRFR